MNHRRPQGERAMRAKDHTQRMLGWWQDIGIERADVAVKRRDPAVMIWHRDLALDSLPLPWARLHNAHHAEVYIRPARGYAWPLVFLDDVAPSLASRIARKYDAMVVRTSPAGGCHIWLACDRPLAEEARLEAQRWLAQCLPADLGSVSGEHLGRLAGFKNWKRAGTWVNVLDTSRHNRPWDPTPALSAAKMRSLASRPDVSPRQTDTSASGREWGWVCGQLEAGISPGVVHASLVNAARARRGPDAERYARRTLKRALEHIALEGHERAVTASGTPV